MKCAEPIVEAKGGNAMRHIQPPRAAAVLLGVIAVGTLVFGPLVSPRSAMAAGPNSVTDWSLISQDAVIVGRPAGSAVYLHAIVLLAIHDAIVAVDGGARPLITSPSVTRPA